MRKNDPEELKKLRQWAEEEGWTAVGQVWIGFLYGRFWGVNQEGRVLNVLVRRDFQDEPWEVYDMRPVPPLEALAYVAVMAAEAGGEEDES